MLALAQEYALIGIKNELSELIEMVDEQRHDCAQNFLRTSSAFFQDFLTPLWIMSLRSRLLEQQQI